MKFFFPLYLARDDISTIWSEERRHLLENPAANEACYTSKVVFFTGFWEKTFPLRRLVTNELRALTSAARAELAKLNPLLSPPKCLDLGGKRGKRGFSLPVLKLSQRESGNAVCELKEKKWERGINTRNLGGEFSSGNVSVPIYRSIRSFPSLFSAFVTQEKSWN